MFFWPTTSKKGRQLYLEYSLRFIIFGCLIEVKFRNRIYQKISRNTLAEQFVIEWLKELGYNHAFGPKTLGFSDTINVKVEKNGKKKNFKKKLQKLQSLFYFLSYQLMICFKFPLDN